MTKKYDQEKMYAKNVKCCNYLLEQKYEIDYECAVRFCRFSRSLDILCIFNEE